MSFCYNTDEKKMDSQQDQCLCGVHTFSPCLAIHGFSLGTLLTSRIPKMCTLGELVCVNCPSLSECGCRCECALRWKGTLCKVGFSILHSDPQGRLWPPVTLNCNKQIRKIIILCDFINLS